MKTITENALKELIKEALEEVTLEKCKKDIITITNAATNTNELFSALNAYLIQNKTHNIPANFNTPGERFFGL